MNNPIQDNILNDVIICMTGIAKGHEFEVNEVFTQKLTKLGNALGSVKCRVNHPGDRGNVLSIVGEATEFYDSTCLDTDGTEKACTKAKILKIYDLPDNDGKKIIALAKQASKFFGMSIDALVKLGKKGKSGFDIAILEGLNAIDFVDHPAATPSLFSYQMKEVGHIQLSTKSIIDTKVVNLDSNEENNLKENLDMAKIKKLEEEVKSEPTPKDEVREVLTLESLAKKFEEMEAKMKAYEGKETPEEEVEEKKEEEKKEVKAEGYEAVEDKKEDKKEDKADEEEESSKKLEAKITEIATRQFTSLLAKTGGKVTLEDKKAPVESTVSSTLNDEQKALVNSLGLDEALYAKNLEAARKATQF